MARSRNIKPGFFANDDLADCDPLARLLFAGLWTIADSNGVLEDRPRKIKAQILPYDNTDPEHLLTQLIEGGFIRRFNVDGLRLIHVVNFDRHQNPHKNEDAKYPLPSPEPVGGFDENVEIASENAVSEDSDTGTRVVPESSDTDRADSLLMIPETRTPPSGSQHKELNRFIDAWNVAASRCDVPKCRAGPPSNQLLRNWKSAQRDADHRAALADCNFDALVTAITEATFGHGKPWFTLAGLLTRNKAGDLKLIYMLNGGYRSECKATELNQSGAKHDPDRGVASAEDWS